MATPSPIALTLYSRSGCHLCEDAYDAVMEVRQRLAGEVVTMLEVVDITTDSDLMAKYRNDIPVLCVEGREAFRHRVDAGTLRRILLGEAL